MRVRRKHGVKEFGNAHRRMLPVDAHPSCYRPSLAVATPRAETTEFPRRARQQAAIPQNPEIVAKPDHHMSRITAGQTEVGRRSARGRSSRQRREIACLKRREDAPQPRAARALRRPDETHSTP
jgi:hypothetical protein